MERTKEARRAVTAGVSADRASLGGKEKDFPRGEHTGKRDVVLSYEEEGRSEKSKPF